MKSSDIFDAIGNADDRFIKEAKEQKSSFHRKMRMLAIPAVAALLAVTLAFGFIFSKPFWEDNEKKPSTTYIFPTYTPKTEFSEEIFNTLSLASPTMPTRIQYKEDSIIEWNKEMSAIIKAYAEAGVDLAEFMERALPVLLGNNEGESIVCSPINIYIAFAMLAEVTVDNTQKEILDVLGVDSIDTLRRQISTIWQATFRDDGKTKALLANSIWLSDEEEYKQETILRLAELYFVSTFSGKVGSEEYNAALREWLNYNTGGLLSDKIEGVKLEEETVLAIASTILLQVGWNSEFSQEKNTEGIFRGTKSNSTCTFMNQSFRDIYYQCKKFTAVKKQLQDGGNMTFILPDKDTSPEALLKSNAFIDFIMEEEYKSIMTAEISLSVPKFDVSSDIDLAKKMEELGIDEIFDVNKADFDLLSERSEKKDFLYLGKASHAARVRIDEQGCIGTAYTLLKTFGATGAVSPPPKIDFILDRPFIFVITNAAGIPLFVGIVNQL